MASSLIRRRRKILCDYLPIRSLHIFPAFGPEQSYKRFNTHSGVFGTVSSSPSSCQPGESDGSSLLKKKLEIFRLASENPALVGFQRRPDFNFLMSVRLILQARSYVSISTAKTPDPGNDEEEEQIAEKKRQETSPEECDQAVVSLSTVKAKARAKLPQKSESLAISVLQKIWATFLGFGPALKAVASMSREDWAKKLVHWKNEFVSTLKHYWLGSKLLWADVRISSRLLMKLAGGKSLSRRERQQLKRTTSDVLRLVPFAVFVIVPFMEFLLPVFLKLFPNMLPSTFQDKLKEEEALKRRLNAKMEYAKFVQEMVKDMALEVRNTRSGETKKTAEDLDEFLSRVRTGARVSNEEILAFAKLFNDELTLDNISRPRLINMCKYMGINSFGTDSYLRYTLRKRLRSIKQDDKLIQAEGVESLSEDELREDCRERGMVGAFSVEEMRDQLRDWLDLSLNHSVPSSLLILSRAFTVSGKMSPEEVVRATLSSLPDEVIDTVGMTSLPSEDPISEKKRKLEFLEMQEELIKEEEDKEEKEQAKKGKSTDVEADIALQEMAVPTAREEAQERARNIALDKQDHLCELSRALAVLASASSVSTEREEFLSLVNKEIELYNSLVDKDGTDPKAEAMKAYKASRFESEDGEEVSERDGISSALIDKVDAMLHSLEKEIDEVDAKIGDHWRILDRDYDGKVTPEEVAAAAAYLKDTLGNEGVHELIKNLSKDSDGKILVEDIVRLGSRTKSGSAVESEDL